MKKFSLKTSEILQGDYALAPLNLMLVFQVNCPGCFVYALPVANEIVKNFQDKGIKILGLSTAFEDFEFNTVENTRLLLESGSLVGETKKTLGKAGYEKFPFNIPFDVAFDELKPREKVDLEKEADEYCATIPDFNNKKDVERKLMKAQVKEYLSHKTMNAHTFDANFLMGTPSWILFDNQFNIIFDFFGHKEYPFLEKMINEALRARGQ